MPALSPYLRTKVIRLSVVTIVSLLVAAGKVLGKVMLQRLINNITESMLPESRCGFRKNRSTGQGD